MKFCKLFIFLLFAGAAVFFGVSYFSEKEVPVDNADAVAYYRERSEVLEEELAVLRAESYKAELAYRSTISELESALVESRGEYIYEKTEGGVVLTGYQGMKKTVEIPSTLDGFCVVGIGREAFRNSSVESVILPVGVKKIDWFAFSGCSVLSRVTIPPSVTVIEYGAFDGCPSLVIYCNKDSFADKYASSYGMRVEYQ